MWIEEYKPGKYRARWREEGKSTPPAGPTFVSRELALSWAETNNLLPTRELRLADVIDQWLDQEPSDYRREAAAILGGLALRQGWVRVADITPAAIALWHRQASEAKREKTGGAIHVARYQQYLLGVLRWAHRTYKVPVHPDVLTMRLPKRQKGPPRTLLTDAQVDDIRKMARSYGPCARNIIEYLLTYGARPITACRLCVRDLVGNTLTIENAKHSGGWRHPVDARQAKRWRAEVYSTAPDAPLFPHYTEDRAWKIKDGKAAELSSWYRCTIAKRLKLPEGVRGIYDLKRWAITRMLDRGLPPADVALFTGHTDLEQVLTYNRTNQDRATKALVLLFAPAKSKSRSKKAAKK